MNANEIDVLMEPHRARLRAVRDQAIADLAALDRAAELMKQAPRTAVSPVDLMSFDIETIQGKHINDAVVIIARHYDGLIQSSVARALLVRAGVLAEENNAASTALYTALNNGVALFEKTGKRGEYRLVENAPWAPQPSPDDVDDTDDETITRMPPRAFSLG